MLGSDSVPSKKLSLITFKLLTKMFRRYKKKKYDMLQRIFHSYFVNTVSSDSFFLVSA